VGKAKLTEKAAKDCRESVDDDGDGEDEESYEDEEDESEKC
jgi:hypothetical protein